MSSFFDRRWQIITSNLGIGYSHALKVSPNSTLEFEGYIHRDQYVKEQDNTKYCYLNGRAGASNEKLVHCLVNF